MKKKTRDQIILATPAGIAAVIAVGATIHANGQLKAAQTIQQQIIEQQTQAQPAVVEVSQ